MAKNSSCVGCIICLVVIVVLAGGGILAWQLLANDDDNKAQGNNNNDDNDKGGLFGTGLFNGGDNDNDETTPTATVAPGDLSSPPTLSPSVAPTIQRYPFYQCDNDNDNNDQQLCCNGLTNLCDWPINNILWGGVHNAMATEDKFVVPNHIQPLEEALEAGFRLVNIDVCYCKGMWQLCHGICGLGEANPYEILSHITTFLEKHPNDVVVVTMELNSSAGQQVVLRDFYQDVWTSIDGLIDLLYVHNNGNDNDDDDPSWPTLRELINQDKRLIAFHLNGPECTGSDDASNECPDGMHWYFRYVQETKFDFESIQDLLDTKTSCEITRGATTSTGAFVGVNSFVTKNELVLDLNGQIETAETINSYDFVTQRIQQCTTEIQQQQGQGDDEGNLVNFLYVDFWSHGDIVQVVQEYNQALGDYTA